MMPHSHRATTQPPIRGATDGPAWYRVCMPSFAHPWSLLLLPLAPLVAWSWLRRPRTALRVPAIHSFADLPAGRATRARRGGASLRGLGVVALVLALAGPRWPDPGTRLTLEGIA